MEFHIFFYLKLMTEMFRAKDEYREGLKIEMGCTKKSFVREG